MNKKALKGGAAVVLAASLLSVGGGSYALWGKTAAVDGGTITNGTLDVAASPATWYDSSADRSDAVAIPGYVGEVGHPIYLTQAAADAAIAAGTAPAGTVAFQGVPGDSVIGSYAIDGALSGDNLVAALDVAGADQAAYNGWTMTYTLTDAAGNVVPGADKVSDFSAIKFSSFNNSHNVTALPTMDGTLNATTPAGEYHLIVKATFNPTTSGTTYTNQNGVTLNGMTVSLNQVRTQDGTGGYITAP